MLPLAILLKAVSDSKVFGSDSAVLLALSKISILIDPILLYSSQLIVPFFFSIGVASLGSALIMYVWAMFTNAVNPNVAVRYAITPYRRGPSGSWALVTGGSSGIGLAICRKLARQGINVIVAAIPDAVLDNAVVSLQSEFPSVDFLSIGVRLGDADYLQVLAKKTEDLEVRLVFCNAGYMVTGFFDDADWSRHDANIACNSTAAIAIAHLFVRRLRAKGLKGAIAFTSSPASCMPSPFSCLYGSTKAMVTHFATSLAGEVRTDGIDVSVLHPSPVATSFYQGAHAMPTLKFFESTATGPDDVAECLMRGLGRSVVIDHGYYSFSMRILQRIADAAFLAEVISRVAHTMSDFTVLKAARAAKKATQAAVAVAATPILDSSSFSSLVAVSAAEGVKSPSRRRAASTSSRK
jgi:short-subunit dehydrogenase